ncbi:hypothetical protein N7467_003093 [Penicillium canescens]|nr:hypothetical protein N7467_003093 [Penicillium canescens]
MLLYCFTSARIGEKSGEDSEDTELEARVIAACYKAIPKHVFYKVYAEDVPIFLNLLMFFLLIATVDNAFTDYGLVSEILDTVEMYKGADSFGKALKWLYAKYYCSGVSKIGFIAHDIANNKIDKTYSESVRIKFARQTNRDIYGKLYAYPLSEVDGPANYLGIASRQEYI